METLLKFWTSKEIDELELRVVRLEEGVGELLEGIATFVTQANDINAQLLRRTEVLEKRADTPTIWRP